MITAKAMYGLSDQLDLHATMHVSPLLFGLLGFEVGAKHFFLKADGMVPVLGLSGGAVLLTSIKPGVERTPVLMPLFSGTSAWQLGPGYIYLGADLVFYVQNFATRDDAPAYSWAPLTGYRWDCSKDWSLALELKRHVANWRTDNVPVDLYTVEWKDGLKTHHPQHGAFGPTLGFTWRL